MRRAVFACNPYNREFASRVAFAATSAPLRSATGDRAEFLGSNGSLASPAALRRPQLTGRFGAGLDPCGRAAGGARARSRAARQSVVFLLGQAQDRAHAEALVDRLASLEAAERARRELRGSWDERLSVVQVSTPDDSFDVMLNGWLLYQTLALPLLGPLGLLPAGRSVSASATSCRT